MDYRTVAEIAIVTRADIEWISIVRTRHNERGRRTKGTEF